MSVNDPCTGQQAVRVLPYVDDIFKLYVSNRLRKCPGFDDELNLFLDKLILIMEKSISLTSEQQLTCLEGLSKLEIYQRTEQVHLNLESFQSMTVVLSYEVARMFQNGEVTWQKIFQILDAVAEVIINIPDMVCLVDQLCHYSKTIHVSNGGQTIAEWISTVGQKVCTGVSEDVHINSNGQTTEEWIFTIGEEACTDVSETINTNSEGQTIEEWISTVGQEFCTDVSETTNMNSEGQTTEEWISTVGQEFCTGASENTRMNSEGQTIEEWISTVRQEVCTDIGENTRMNSEGHTIEEWISTVGQEVCADLSENTRMNSGGQNIEEWISTAGQEVRTDVGAIIYVRSGGQTIGEWISSAGQKLHQSFEEESSRIQESDVLAESNQSVVEKPLETREEYTTKCPCGSTVFWSALLYGQCQACSKYPCVIAGCNKTFTLKTYLRQHLYADHTNQEETVIFEKRKRYEDIHCIRCWAPSPARGISAHTKCSSCNHFLCLRGHCRVAYKNFAGIQSHQTKCAYFFPGNKCGFCGGEKIKSIGQLTKCPKANCTAFWCNLCDYEGRNVQ